MRLFIACVLLAVTPAAAVFAYREYQSIRAARHGVEWPDRGEVLFFNATWCGPCRKMKPIVASMRRQGYRMRDVDVDRNRSLADQYGIRAVPTFVFLENGEEVRRLSGGTTPQRLRGLCGPAYTR